jgi:hypothetical protein
VVEQEEKRELLLAVVLLIHLVEMVVQVVADPLNQLLVLEMVTHLQ